MQRLLSFSDVRRPPTQTGVDQPNVHAGRETLDGRNRKDGVQVSPEVHGGGMPGCYAGPRSRRPLADVCVGLVIRHCSAMLSKIAKHVASDADLPIAATSCHPPHPPSRPPRGQHTDHVVAARSWQTPRMSDGHHAITLSRYHAAADAPC